MNLYIEAEDYIKLLQNFDCYMNEELKFIESDRKYPVATLDDVTIYFVHYKNREEVLEKWANRKARMNMKNCYIFFTDRDGCTKEHLIKFDELPYKNKVVFTNKKYPDISSAFYIKGFEDKECVGSLFGFTGWNGKKYYDEFDYVSWFNGDMQYPKKQQQ